MYLNNVQTQQIPSTAERKTKYKVYIIIELPNAPHRTNAIKSIGRLTLYAIFTPQVHMQSTTSCFLNKKLTAFNNNPQNEIESVCRIIFYTSIFYPSATQTLQQSEPSTISARVKPNAPYIKTYIYFIKPSINPQFHAEHKTEQLPQVASAQQLHLRDDSVYIFRHQVNRHPALRRYAPSVHINFALCHIYSSRSATASSFHPLFAYTSSLPTIKLCLYTGTHRILDI